MTHDECLADGGHFPKPICVPSVRRRDGNGRIYPRFASRLSFVLCARCGKTLQRGARR